jgi:hypothetical protein
MKLNGKTVVTIVVISALTNVALGHLSAARKGA